MLRSMQFPIALKLIIVTTSILLIAMVPVALRNSDLFLKVSGKREEDTNRSQAEARANEIQLIIQGFVDKTVTMGTLALQEEAEAKSGRPDAADYAKQSLAFIFERESDFVSLSLFTRSNEGFKLSKRMVNPAFLKNYKLPADYLSQIDRRLPFSLQPVFAGQLQLKNRSLEKGAPLLSIGVPIAKDSLDQVTHIALADMQLFRLQKSFAAASERTLYLVDGDGFVLAHPDENLVLSRASRGKSPVVIKAKKSKMSIGQLRYWNPQVKQYFISAFSKTSFGLIVISEAPEAVILEAARYVQRQAMLITGIVMSASLFVIFLFSLTLSRPLEKLVYLAQLIGKGDFSFSARNYIKSKDEVGTLAAAFDGMTLGLRERDKVKNLFNKFHGSSVTESLLSRDEIRIGGERKNVAVLFSDIRSFTSFSEKRTPEEVVSMLNEYFSVMVSIVNRHHGIVDKFIGDAIMAVWGAPKSQGNDAYNAVRACLDMRIELEELNRVRLLRGEEAIMIGIGVHWGEAVAGTIGSEARMEYTIIGDTVNVASRIEAATKAFGTDLLISQTAMEQIGKKFWIERVGAAEVKGKSEPLSLYRVHGTYSDTGEPVLVRTPYSDFHAEAADKVKVV